MILNPKTNFDYATHGLFILH